MWVKTPYSQTQCFDFYIFSENRQKYEYFVLRERKVVHISGLYNLPKLEKIDMIQWTPFILSLTKFAPFKGLALTTSGTKLVDRCSSNGLKVCAIPGEIDNFVEKLWEFHN